MVIVHLDPNYKSHMAELLQRHTSMRVRQVARATRVEPDEVYVIPPDKDLTLVDGHFRLAPRALPNRTRAPIDGFFRTLADTRTNEAIGIVLSGTGTDGTQGIKWIKEKGGITMAQAPGEAEHRAMPESAIATGLVDVVLPAEKLGAEGLRLWRGTSEDKAAEGTFEDQRDDDELEKILTLLRTATGHDFRPYKRATIARRIARRLEIARSASLADYRRLLEEGQDEIRPLYNDLLISVTAFFRDPEAFEALSGKIIPSLFEKRQSSGPIRVWVSGCATGEEAYSIAILLCEHAERLSDSPAFQIFATDVHESALRIARAGSYPESITANVSLNRLEKFFKRGKTGYSVRKSIRGNIVFAPHNLLSDPPFRRLDLICCRNLLIYLRRDAQRLVLTNFNSALREGGALFLGTSESVDDPAQLFAVVDKKQRIFTSREVPRPGKQQAANGVKGEASNISERPTRDTDFRSSEEIHQKLLEAYGPPSLVVDAGGEILHLSDGVGDFLHLTGGEPSKKLLDLLPRSAQGKARKLLSTVFKSGERTAAWGISLPLRGSKRIVDLIALPHKVAGKTVTRALVVFVEQGEPEAPPPQDPASPEPRRKSVRAIKELTTELNEIRSQLNITIGEHEETIEELKASNEELQSINEEQRATEEELEASKEELQSLNEELHTVNQEFRFKNDELGDLNADLGNLIDSTDLATIFLDKSLRVRRFTPASAALFNILQSDIGRPLADLTHRLDYDTLLEDAREVLRTLAREERDIRTDDGLWYTVRITPYRSSEDRIDGVVLALFETTARKTAEIEREHLLAEVQAASVAKSNFIGVMSHELRTPLNAILGYADILTVGAAGPVSPQQAEHLDRIKTSARHLAHMIDDSLQSVRLEAGVTTLGNEIVDVAKVVREVANATGPLIAAKHLSFRVDAVDGPPIFADATKIRQILFNLLSNAVRYTDSGSINISCRVGSLGATITVEDTGIGISTEHLDRIFERFWQVDQSRTRVRGGAGLGLMVSRSLARVMGGDLDVTSELGRGSKFVLRLPLGGSTD